MASFAVEAPGEAVPLTDADVVRTLQAAASSRPIHITSGTQQLARWEKSPRYYRHLQSAYLSAHLPVELRYLAIIQLKHGVDKYWRKTALNAVPPDDKLVIRGRLVGGVVEQADDRLALQAALVVAKIARYEFPHDWPDAITAFLRLVQSHPTSLHFARALLALLHLVKELSTGRMQSTRRHLQAATPDIVAAVGHAYAQLVTQWRGALQADGMRQSLLAVKLLRRLFVAGYEHPHRHAHVTAFWNLSLDHLTLFTRLVKETTLPTEWAGLLGRHALQLAKLHHEMARDHPAAFALLPNSLQLVMSYWSLVKDFGGAFGSKEAIVSTVADARIGSDGDAPGDKSCVEKISLKGLLIIRACVKMVHSPANTFKYRTPDDKEEKHRATETLRQTLLVDSFVREVMEVLVTKFFVFRASDLKEWLEEPEEWEKREEGDGDDWEFSVRSCSEKLFLDLAINYKDILVEPLLNVFYSVANPQNEDVLFKDSVYTAIGLAAPVIYPHLDFDAFIRDVLVQELQNTSPGFNILRRRAAILLGQWVGVKMSDVSKQIVYQIFQHLLNDEDPLNDQVVRVTAGRQLAHVANDWEFKVDAFLPRAPTILTQLMTLVGDVELTETKMALLNTVSLIIDRLGQHVTPYAERIVTPLPSLWDQSGEEHLMKQAVLTILARLVSAMKAQSLPLHPMVLPIIKGAVEPGSETQLYLLEDALDLWSNVLQQTPDGSASPELLGLVQYLYPIYELGSENARTALSIARSYLLAAPHHMLSAPIRPGLLLALTHLLGDLSNDANRVVCQLVEDALRLAQRPEVASALAVGGFGSASAMIIHDLAHVTDPERGKFGVLQKLLEGLRGSWDAHRTTGPNQKAPAVCGIVETDYFAIIARAVLASLDGFLYAFQKAAADVTGGAAVEDGMKWFLDEWFSHVDDVSLPSRKKLMCLALTKLLETNQPFILLQLQSLMTLWTDVVVELREDEADVGGDCLVYSSNAATTTTTTTTTNEWGPESPEETRERALTTTDDVHTIKVPEFIKHHLQQAIAAAGGSDQFQEQWLVNVDRDVVTAFSRLGIM